MATFKDLGEFFDPDLHLPIRGKTYTVKSPNALDGLRLRRYFDSPSTVLDDTEQIVEIAKLLGAQWDEENKEWSGGLWSEMSNDGVTWAELMHVGNTALINFGMTPELAQSYWSKDAKDTKENLPGNPATPDTTGENRQERRAAAKKSAKKAAPKKST